MGLSEVRNHANLILNIIRLITKKENFYDVKNEVMESVRSVIPCEKISINMIPKENAKEVQLVYSYTNKSSKRRRTRSFSGSVSYPLLEMKP